MKHIDNDPNIFTQTKCGICKKKVASRLCDFVVEYRRPVFFKNYEDFKEQELHGTCDFPMCEDCTNSFNEIYDFCPHHEKFIKQIKPTDEMKSAINEHVMKDIFGNGKLL